MRRYGKMAWYTGAAELELGRGEVGAAVDDEAVVVAVRVALEVVLQDVELDARAEISFDEPESQNISFGGRKSLIVLVPNAFHVRCVRSREARRLYSTSRLS